MPGTKKKTNMAAAGFSRYSAIKGRQFRLALPQDDSNDSDDHGLLSLQLKSQVVKDYQLLLKGSY